MLGRFRKPHRVRPPRGETRKQFGFFAHFAKNRRFGVFCDVVGNGKFTKRARTFRVHTAF